MFGDKGIVVNDLQPGDPQHIGRYRLLGRLGRGGMGTVYLGEDQTGQRVAVKVINPEYTQHEQFRMRFRREADAARRVRRFCTAAVLDSALEGDQLYVVTEYVEGRDLEETVRASGPLRGSSLDALAVGVATALTAIHGAGIVHRDLKPSNVLLSPVGPRVIDFGIARALDTLGGVTGTGEIIGTPRYMAPEALRGEPVSPACDVFSWGCLVAYAGTGRSPFGGEGALPSVLYQILNNEPVLDGLEPNLRELVAAALSKDPARRPTAQQLLDSMIGRVSPEHAEHSVVQAWRQGGPPSAQPGNAPRQPTTPYIGTLPHQGVPGSAGGTYPGGAYPSGPLQSGPATGFPGAAPYRGEPYQGEPYQGGLYQGGPRQGGPYQSDPQQGGPYQGGTQHGGPYQSEPQQGGPYQGGQRQGGGPYQPDATRPGGPFESTGPQHADAAFQHAAPQPGATYQHAAPQYPAPDRNTVPRPGEPPTPTTPATATSTERRPTDRRKSLIGAVVAGPVAVVLIIMVVRLLLSPSGPPEDLTRLYGDDFTQSDSGWTGSYDGDSQTYGYAPGGYYAMDVSGTNSEHQEKAPIPFVREQPTTPPSTTDTPTPTTPGTLLIGVDADPGKPSGYGEYGVFCRSDGDYRVSQYEFLLDSSGNARIRKVVKGSGGNIADPVKVDGQPAKARIQVECESEGAAVHLKMWVDGEQVHDVTDEVGLRNGDIGLLARVPENGDSVLKMRYDNFTLHGPKQGASASD
ncbi:protein kinase [Thermopolyspora sp. NPDC052614]|uniref:serine/threonine protein kinase n=1 Tax=Thermopolyspora sp. NPDC052614 TaxID=3155682 RepID=UPI003434185D